MRLLLFILAILNFLSFTTSAQTVIKEYPAHRTTSVFKIDGNLDEEVWKSVAPMSGMISFQPYFGTPEEFQNRTEVYIFYDNENIYVGGYCHEATADSVSRELVGRDVVGSSDFLGVIFDTYNDKINGTGFYVTAYGEQFDAKYSGSGDEDPTWNAVWESAAKLQSDGWTFEMRIPYSALRFSNQDRQNWGINLIRDRVKAGLKYSWAPLDPKINGLMNQEGLWTGIEKIQSPLRLSFSPYFSAYLNHYPYKTEGIKDFNASLNGGMDLKYGINESFTLDMTLIPDFGQVQSDNQVLNLSPFEVKYNENRSFFTEGTELFSKGNIFYSRRIGNAPLHFYDVYNQMAADEKMIRNPKESKLINATKISGRTANGLGVGMLNAITQPMYAVVENEKGERRKIKTSPLTNFNILVVDQSLKNNSSISLINTSVIREGKDYDANVTAAVVDFNNKKNTYGWGGDLALSNILLPQSKTITGYAHILRFAKTGGKLLVQVNQELKDKKFNPNDLGILFNNNFLDHTLRMSYRWLKPSDWYKTLTVNYNLTYSRRFTPSAFQHLVTNINANSLLKNRTRIGIYTSYSTKGNDFYEARIPGQVYKSPSEYNLEIWGTSDNSKRFSVLIDLTLGKYGTFNGKYYELVMENNFRVNDKLSFTYKLVNHPQTNQVGFATFDSGKVLFSRRNIQSVENSLPIKYNFNRKHGISFNLRHYWSEVKPKEYFDLQSDGNLKSNTTFTGNTNQSFNAFNIDMVYTWEFAPGSFVNIVWKNSIYNGSQLLKENYFKNLENTLSLPQNNNLSLKVIYYLDALMFKNKSSIK